MDEVQALASQADEPFNSLSMHPCSFLLFLCGTLGWGQQSGEQPSREEDYSICMQVVNFGSCITAEAGWINFESLIFINLSVREKYKEMTQLPSELRCRATALQSQVHNTLIDQEGVNPYEGR